MSLLDLLRANQIEPKKMATTGGGEFACACPGCGGRDRLRIWPNRDRYWCRRCGETGDSIQFLRTFKGMTYAEACKHLGIKPKPLSSARRVPCRQQTRSPKWEPKTVVEPPELWTVQAAKFLNYSISRLWSDAGRETRDWLRTERGFTEDSIRAFRLGWNPHELWRNRSAWGLRLEINKMTGKPKQLWLPRGCAIPLLHGEVIRRIKIRRPEPDADHRYYFTPGSSTQAMTIGCTDMPVIVVVESALDGILLFQEAGNRVGVVCLESASIRPDTVTMCILRAAKSILIGLDADPAGAKESWRWWRENFPQARRWPPVQGKDPGEMWKAGVSVSAWVKAGIEEYAKGENVSDTNVGALQELYEERAAIMEYDGSVPRKRAEAMASMLMSLDRRASTERADEGEGHITLFRLHDDHAIGESVLKKL